MLPAAIAALAFASHWLLCSGAALQSMGKYVIPAGREPEWAESQLYAQEASLYVVLAFILEIDSGRLTVPRVEVPSEARVIECQTLLNTALASVQESGVGGPVCRW